jgi:hypothetical protein
MSEMPPNHAWEDDAKNLALKIKSGDPLTTSECIDLESFRGYQTQCLECLLRTKDQYKEDEGNDDPFCVDVVEEVEERLLNLMTLDLGADFSWLY